jgi:hypothetical protein
MVKYYFYMSDKLNGGLYTSNDQVRRVHKVFLQVHQCYHCERYFTEFENLGSWKCHYHPGKFDFRTRKWTCCGEEERKAVGQFSYLGSYMSWSEKERINMPNPHGRGCCRCDCISIYDNPVPKEEVMLEDIACIIPSLKDHGKDLKERPGLVKGARLRIQRKEHLPKLFYHANNPFLK